MAFMESAIFILISEFKCVYEVVDQFNHYTYCNKDWITRFGYYGEKIVFWIKKNVLYGFDKKKKPTDYLN